MLLLLRCLVLAAALLVPPVSAAADSVPWRFESAPRVVAMADVHGDLGATRRALRLAGAIDAQDRWVGGELVVVQTGDYLDRGDDERAIMDLLARLEEEAAAAGGAVHVLVGNHELMNAKRDLRYVTEGGYRDFEGAAEVPADDPMLAEYPEHARARVAAFRPGGPYARQLARRNAVVVVGETAFVHGGVLPEHIDYGVGRMNAELQLWLSGDGPVPEWTTKKESVVWTRRFSSDVDDDACELLRQSLQALGAKRLVVGHSVHSEITSYCDGRVWCIDTKARFGSSKSRATPSLF